MPPQDDDGHGTHIAGTVAATLNNDVGISGVAPGTSIMPVKVLDAKGVGRDSTVAAGIRWATDHGARIVNMSFGGNQVSPVLTDAVTYAASRGVVLVVAAGNDAGSEPNYPAASAPAIAVAATNRQDQRPAFSNYGTWVHLAAPGTSILNTFWDGASTYRTLSGTSMAAAHVSGVAALLLSVASDLTPPEVDDILRATADPVVDPGLGAGRLNAARAVASALARPPGAGPASPGLPSPPGAAAASPGLTSPPAAPSPATATPRPTPPEPVSTPVPPGLLEVTDVTSRTVSLRWQPSSGPNLIDYAVYQCNESGGSCSVAAVRGPSITSMTLTGLAPETSYRFYVQARNTAGSSGSSNTVTIRTRAEPTPIIFHGLVGPFIPDGL
jgi:hypothetical protein